MLKKLCSMTVLLCSSMSYAQDSGLVLSKGLTDLEVKAIATDVENLRSLDFEGDVVAGYKKIFNSSRINGEELYTWMRERVNVVVEESFSFEENLIVPGASKRLLAATQGEGVTVMSNVGAAIYNLGKQYKIVLSLRVPTTESEEIIKVDSPRAGILQVGEGMFMRSAQHSKEPTHYAGSLARTATLLHEGRHSDGHGENLAFSHNKCPRGHALEGAYGCDYNGNGPYAIGGIYTWELANKCPLEKCSERDKLLFKAQAMDSFSRIMMLNGKLIFHDPEPERM